MNNDTKTMITIRMLQLGLTQYDVAEKLSISQGSLSNLLAGRREFSADKLKQLEELLQIQNGDLLRVHQGTISQDVNNIHDLPILEPHEVSSWVKHKKLPSNARSRKIMLGNKEVFGDCFLMPVMNNTMEALGNPQSLKKGDHVVVDTKKKPVPNESLVIAQINGEDARIRLLEKDGNKLFLRAFDSHYPLIEVTPEVSILGVIVSSSRDYAN